MSNKSWLPLRNGKHRTTEWYKNTWNPLPNNKDIEIVTARRLRKGRKPLIGKYYEAINIPKLIHCITTPKNISLPEVKTTFAFLLGSILFTISGALDLGDIHQATYLFVIRSTSFLLGAYWQIDQMIKTHKLHLQGRIDHVVKLHNSINFKSWNNCLQFQQLFFIHSPKSHRRGMAFL